MDRVKFYSTYDWACGTNLKKLEEVLDKFDDNKNYEINDIIEFYNCIKYIDKGCYLNDWTTYLFFSDQCMLKYIERIEEKYSNFFDTIKYVFLIN